MLKTLLTLSVATLVAGSLFFGGTGTASAAPPHRYGRYCYPDRPDCRDWDRCYPDRPGCCDWDRRCRPDCWDRWRPDPWDRYGQSRGYYRERRRSSYSHGWRR
jgi:hypothetical protein